MKSKLPFICLVIGLACAFWIYLPGLSGGLMFDDFPNIVTNDRLHINSLESTELIRATYSGFAGPLKRPVSMLSFALNIYATGLDPYFMKLTNVVIHLCNGLMVFALTVLLLRGYRRLVELPPSNSHIHWLAVAVVCTWLLHPIQLTSILYVVQRMTSLASFFMLCGLVCYVWGRLRLLDGKSGVLLIVASIFPFGVLGVFSKETGALLPLYMFVVEFTIFRFRTTTVSLRRFLYTFYGFILIFPILVLASVFLVQPDIVLGGYQIRDFTLWQRLMTEARVLCFYIKMIVLPNNAQLGLFHDDIVLSRGLAHPTTTILSIICVAALLTAALRCRKQIPILSFGILFFLAGHSMESTIFPLEITHEHRNYLPSFGIIFMLFFYLMYPFRYMTTISIRRYAAVAFIGLFAINTAARAKQWEDPMTRSLFDVEHHPKSWRANLDAGHSYATLLVLLKEEDKKNRGTLYTEARRYFNRSSELHPSAIAFIGMIILDCQNGKPRDGMLLEKLEEQLSSVPISAATVYSMYALFDHHSFGICVLRDEEITGIIQATGANPDFGGAYGASIATIFSNYLANEKKDYESALFFSKLAMQLNPDDLQNRLNVVELLSAFGAYEAAEEQLDDIEQQDWLDVYGEEIDKKRVKLSRLKRTLSFPTGRGIIELEKVATGGGADRLNRKPGGTNRIARPGKGR